MRKEEEIRAKVAECIDNLRELAAKSIIGTEDLIVYDRSELHLSTLLWALNEPPPGEEVQKLADSVVQKFRQAKGLSPTTGGALKRKKS